MIRVAAMLALLAACNEPRCAEYVVKRVWVAPRTDYVRIGNIVTPVSRGGYWADERVCVRRISSEVKR